MQNDKIVFLINDMARAVKLEYDPADNERSWSLGKTLNQDLKVDDMVIVQSDTRHKMTVARVAEVDVDLDVESSEPIRWIFGSVDTTTRDTLLGQEAEALKTVQEAEKSRKRAALRKSLFDNAQEKMAALAIAHQSDDDVTE